MDAGDLKIFEAVARPGRRGLALLGAVALLMAGPLGAALLAQPAAAQQAAPGAGRAAAPHPLNLQPPAPDPPPAVGAPRLVPGSPEAQDCVPAWPCRLRLFGEIEKYGGVGLKATALTW
jgi:hypothetical protein